MKHELWELQSMQAASLQTKISLTKQRIREWVNHFGEDGVYVSFSGGKDSTVLLHLVREEYPDVPAVFCDVPTQYPELKQFAQTFENVTIVRPRLSFMDVCEKYGFPLISKEVAETVSGARKYLTRIIEQENLANERTNERHTSTVWKDCADLESMRQLTGGGTAGSTGRLAESENLLPRMAETLRNRQIWQAVQQCKIGGGGAARDFANLTGIRTNKSRNVDVRLWKGYRQSTSPDHDGNATDGRQSDSGEYP